MDFKDLFDRLKKALNDVQQAQPAAPAAQSAPEPAPLPEPAPSPEPAKEPFHDPLFVDFPDADMDPDEKMDCVQARAVMAQMMMRTAKSVLRLTLTDQVPDLFGSKVGGVPYLPADAEIPRDADGTPLRMLAQIDCTELSALPDFPQEGLLQFWIGQDITAGLDAAGGSRVIYYPQIDRSVTEDAVRARLAAFPVPEDAMYPVNGTFGIAMKAGSDSLSAQDVHFDPMFTELFNQDAPNEQIGELYDLGDIIGEMVYEQMDGCGHKIGGYPGFTHTDPRGLDDPRTVVLFQLDSDYEPGTAPEKVMWGDAGIGAFFCSPEALAARDFSDVLYNWDCG